MLLLALLTIFLIWFVVYRIRVTERNKLNEIDRAKLSSYKKRNFTPLIITAIGIIALLWWTSSLYGTLAIIPFLIGFPILLVIVTLSSIHKSIKQYRKLKLLGVPESYTYTVCLARIIASISYTLIIIGLMAFIFSTLGPQIRQRFYNQVYNQLFPKKLDTTNINYWVCPQAVSCKNGDCAGEGGYGKFKFRAYYPVDAPIPNGFYEFTSAEMNRNAKFPQLPPHVRSKNPVFTYDRTKPPELFCEYGIATIFGSGRIEVIALVQGVFAQDFFDKLPAFNPYWVSGDESQDHLTCQRLESIDCKFPTFSH